MKRLSLLLAVLLGLPAAARLARADDSENIEAELAKARAALAEMKARLQAQEAAAAEARKAADRIRAAAVALRKEQADVELSAEKKRGAAWLQSWLRDASRADQPSLADRVIVLDLTQSDEDFAKAAKEALPDADVTRKDGFIVIRQGGNVTQTKTVRVLKPLTTADGVLTLRWADGVAQPEAPTPHRVPPFTFEPTPPAPPVPPAPPAPAVAPVPPVPPTPPTPASDDVRESVRRLSEEMRALREDLKALREALRADRDAR